MAKVREAQTVISLPRSRGEPDSSLDLDGLREAKAKASGRPCSSLLPSSSGGGASDASLLPAAATVSPYSPPAGSRHLDGAWLAFPTPNLQPMLLVDRATARRPTLAVSVRATGGWKIPMFAAGEWVRWAGQDRIRRGIILPSYHVLDARPGGN